MADFDRVNLLMYHKIKPKLFETHFFNLKEQYSRVIINDKSNYLLTPSGE